MDLADAGGREVQHDAFGRSEHGLQARVVLADGLEVGERAVEAVCGVARGRSVVAVGALAEALEALLEREDRFERALGGHEAAAQHVVGFEAELGLVIRRHRGDRAAQSLDAFLVVLVLELALRDFEQQAAGNEAAARREDLAQDRLGLHTDVIVRVAVVDLLRHVERLLHLGCIARLGQEAALRQQRQVAEARVADVQDVLALLSILAEVLAERREHLLRGRRVALLEQQFAEVRVDLLHHVEEERQRVAAQLRLFASKRDGDLLDRRAVAADRVRGLASDFAALGDLEESAQADRSLLAELEHHFLEFADRASGLDLAVLLHGAAKFAHEHALAHPVEAVFELDLRVLRGLRLDRRHDLVT